MSYKNNPAYIEEQIRKQKDTAETVLTKLALFGFEKAVCAGGAPRDWYLGKIAKDLDFFVDNKVNGVEFNIEKFLDFLGVKVYDKLEHSGIYEANPRLESVFEFDFNGSVCQLIVVQPHGVDDKSVKAWDIYKTFPVNVSKIAYCDDGWNGFIFMKSDDFVYGHKYKILDFDEENLYNGYYKRKIRRKFKDYALVLRKKPSWIERYGTKDDIVDTTWNVLTAKYPLP